MRMDRAGLAEKAHDLVKKSGERLYPALKGTRTIISTVLFVVLEKLR